MEIYAKVYGEKGNVLSETGSFEVKIDNSFTPSNLWIIGLRDEKRDIIYRKVSQVIFGKVVYKNTVFEVQVALFHYDNFFHASLLLYSECPLNLSISLRQREEMNVGEDFVDDWILFDFDEISKISEYDGLNFKEVVAKIVKDDGYIGKLHYNTFRDTDK